MQDLGPLLVTPDQRGPPHVIEGDLEQAPASPLPVQFRGFRVQLCSSFRVTFEQVFVAQADQVRAEQFRTAQIPGLDQTFLIELLGLLKVSAVARYIGQVAEGPRNAYRVPGVAVERQTLLEQLRRTLVVTLVRRNNPKYVLEVSRDYLTQLCFYAQLHTLFGSRFRPIKVTLLVRQPARPFEDLGSRLRRRIIVFVQERGDSFEHVHGEVSSWVAHLLYSLQGAPAREDRQPCKERLLSLVEHLVAPRDSVPEGPLPLGEVSRPAGQQLEAVAQAG